MGLMASRRVRIALAGAGIAGLLAGCGAGGGRAVTTTAAPPLIDAGAGIAVSRPHGWHITKPPITSLGYPRERLLLTSLAARRGGNCSPDRAVGELPAGGALVYLLEFRPAHGSVWKGLRRRAFPPRPAHFALDRRDLGHYECWRAPSYLMRFRAADRPFQLHVALGDHTGAARRAQVLRMLDSLRFSALPAPSR